VPYGSCFVFCTHSCWCCYSSQRSTMDSRGGGRNKQRNLDRTESPPPRRRSQSGNNSPSEASQSQIQAAGGSNSTGSRSRGAERPRSVPVQTTQTPTEPSKTGSGGVGAFEFGPVVGLSVVVAVSMAGLLGGWLWAVACVCAWLAALSRLRRRREAAAVDEDSADHEKPAVLRGMLERGRRKAAAT
jgi:hypothetical protein